jgi:2-polyprenyl-3-methyl-5-hydroxy-6-metoxy-1,4-benzoquinol methylase/DNA-binding ferritin-like protein (Dps family)
MLERLDPALRSDRLAIDHYARYSFSLPLVRGKRVLDIACGFGYGSHMMAVYGALEVIGMDISEEAIDYAQKFYKHDNIKYTVKDLLDLDVGHGLFDVVTCFETLEHTSDIELAIYRLSCVLKEDGVLVVSVPNDLGKKVENKYHLHKFTELELIGDLARIFRFVDAYYQSYILASLIWKKGHPNPPEEKNLALVSNVRCYMNGTLDELELEPDCFIATCSNSVLPSLSTTVVYSGSAWNEYSRSWQEYEEELVTARERLWAETQHWHRAWQESEAQRAALGADYERLWAETQHWHRAWQESEAQRAALGADYERLWAETQHWHRAWQESEAQRAALGADYERLWAETQHWRYIKYQVSHFFQILRRIVRRILPF